MDCLFYWYMFAIRDIYIGLGDLVPTYLDHVLSFLLTLSLSPFVCAFSLSQKAASLHSLVLVGLVVLALLLP